MYHMTSLQVIFNTSKNWVNAKEDTGKASSNFLLAASEGQSYTATNLSSPALQFDIKHANIKVICDSSKIRADTKEDTAIACPNA